MAAGPEILSWLEILTDGDTGSPKRLKNVPILSPVVYDVRNPSRTALFGSCQKDCAPVVWVAVNMQGADEWFDQSSL